MTRSHRVSSFFFAQPAALERIAGVRAVLGVSIFLLVLLGPYDHFFADSAALLYQPGGLLAFVPPLSATALSALRGLVLVSSLAMAVGLSTRLSVALTAVSFLVLNSYVAHFVGISWNYNTHLNFFAIALAFTQCGRHFSFDGWLAARRGKGALAEANGQALAAASFALAFMMVYVGFLYLQAGLAKLLGGGVAWFVSGMTPFAFTITDGTSLGRWLTQWPGIFQVFTMVSGLFELSFLLLFCSFPRLRRALVVGAVALHLGMWAVMGISFWHLWVLYVPLFGLVPLRLPQLLKSVGGRAPVTARAEAVTRVNP